MPSYLHEIYDMTYVNSDRLISIYLVSWIQLFQSIIVDFFLLYIFPI